MEANPNNPTCLAILRARRKSRFTTELRAGTVTFLTMAYILAVGRWQTAGGISVAPVTSKNVRPAADLRTRTHWFVPLLRRK